MSLQHSGTIIAWKDRQSGGRDLLFHQSRGALDHFYLHPQWTRPMPMLLSHADIVDGAPEATLEYQIKPLHQAVAIYDPQEGLLIKKQIRLSKDGLSVQARITLTNLNPRQKKLPAGIRVKCFPRLGSNFAGSKFLPSIFNLKLDGNSYNATHFTSNTAYNYFLMEAKNLQPYQKVLPGKTLQTFKNPLLLLQARSEGHEETMTALCDPGNTAGLYVYYSQAAVTVEFLSDYVTLPCGDSLTYQYEFTQHEKNP